MKQSKTFICALIFYSSFLTIGASAAEPKLTRVTRNGHEISIKDYAGAEPAFVMVHGFPDNQHIYDELAAIISSRGQRVVTFDFLGYGDSEKPSSFKYSFEQQLSDLTAVVDNLGLKTFTPVAHDSGGPAVINYSVQNPKRINSIILLNTYYSKTSTLRFPELIALNAEPQLKSLASAMLADPTQRTWLFKFQFGQFLANEPAEFRSRLQSILIPIILTNFNSVPGAGPAFAAMTSDLYSNLSSNTKRLSQLRKISSPVILIWGSQDPYLNAGVAADLADQFKQSETHLIPVGHWPQIDDPKSVADLILGMKK